jgi:hypothetical protein
MRLAYSLALDLLLDFPLSGSGSFQLNSCQLRLIPSSPDGVSPLLGLGDFLLSSALGRTDGILSGPALVALRSC